MFKLLNKVAIFLLFTKSLIALNYITDTIKLLDNTITISIKSVADSKPVDMVCNFLLSVAKEVDSCESYKGYDWQDVAYKEYLAGRNPSYPTIIALLNCLRLMAFQEVRRVAAEPGEVEQKTENDQGSFDDFAMYKECQNNIINVINNTPLEKRNELITSNYQPINVIERFVFTLGFERAKGILTEFVGNMKYQDDWYKFIILPGDNCISTSYGIDQENYGSLMSSAVEIAANLIKSNGTYKEVSSFASLARSAISSTSKNSCNYTHGGLRHSFMATLMILIYEVPEEHYRQLLDSWGNLDSSIIERKENIPSTELPGYLMHYGDGKKYTCITFKGYIDGVLYPLSSLYSKNDSLIYLVHTSHDVLEKTNDGYDHLSKLYEDSLLMENKDELIKKLGEFFWWYCQLKPVSRGDPSIAEIKVKAAIRAKGFEVPGWKNGIIPWLEVVLEPNPKIFGNNFESYLDW